MKPIAIIGMSSIFPQAEDLTQYWDNKYPGGNRLYHRGPCIPMGNKRLL